MLQRLMSTGSSRREVVNFDFFEDPTFSYPDRSMLRPPVIPGLPLRSNKFRPLTPFNADTSTYTVSCLDTVDMKTYRGVVVDQLIGHMKDRAFGLIYVDNGVYLRPNRTRANAA
jgi:hypothetical protein